MRVSSWREPSSGRVWRVPTDEAFANPLMGLMGRPMLYRAQPLSSLVRQFVPWHEIESHGDDDADRIRRFARDHWSGLRRRNVKVVPRIILEHPQRGGRYWPWDLESGDYLSAAFRERVRGLIRKLGEAWNDDPRVAWIETGLIGWWGEHHTPSPDEAMQELIGTEMEAAFPDRYLLRRYPSEFDRPAWGLYWDSFGCSSGQDDHTQEGLAARPQMFRTAPISGEIAYDHCSPGGSTPEESVTDPAHTATLVALARRHHATALGWVSDARPGPRTSAGLQAIQRALGYRFVIDSATYSARCEPGGPFRIELRVRNTGSAPCYVDWPLECRFSDPATGRTTWRTRFPSTDLTDWQPGDDWVPAEARYRVPASPHVAAARFTLPPSLPAGLHEVSVAVLDPASGEPSLRFAVRNYRTGGTHPLGLVSVGVDRDPPELDPRGFDRLADDRTLRY